MDWLMRLVRTGPSGFCQAVLFEGGEDQTHVVADLENEVGVGILDSGLQAETSP